VQKRLQFKKTKELANMVVEKQWQALCLQTFVPLCYDTTVMHVKQKRYINYGLQA